MDNTHGLDYLDNLANELENDPREFVDIEMKEGRFSLMTLLAMNNTLNLSEVELPKGPKLRTEAEALFVLSRREPSECDTESFIEYYIRPTVYRYPKEHYFQVPIHPKFVKLIKEMNAGSGVRQATLGSTLNNILDMFFRSNIEVSNKVKLGVEKKE